MIHLTGKSGQRNKTWIQAVLPTILTTDVTQSDMTIVGAGEYTVVVADKAAFEL